MSIPEVVEVACVGGPIHGEIRMYPLEQPGITLRYTEDFPMMVPVPEYLDDGPANPPVFREEKYYLMEFSKDGKSRWALVHEGQNDADKVARVVDEIFKERKELITYIRGGIEKRANEAYENLTSVSGYFAPNSPTQSTFSPGYGYEEREEEGEPKDLEDLERDVDI